MPPGAPPGICEDMRAHIQGGLRGTLPRPAYARNTFRRGAIRGRDTLGRRGGRPGRSPRHLQGDARHPVAKCRLDGNPGDTPRAKLQHPPQEQHRQRLRRLVLALTAVCGGRVGALRGHAGTPRYAILRRPHAQDGPEALPATWRGRRPGNLRGQQDGRSAEGLPGGRRRRCPAHA